MPRILSRLFLSQITNRISPLLLLSFYGFSNRKLLSNYYCLRKHQKSIKIVITIQNMDCKSAVSEAETEIDCKSDKEQGPEQEPSFLLGDNFLFEINLSDEDEETAKRERVATVLADRKAKEDKKEAEFAENLRVWKHVLSLNLGKAKFPDLRIFRNRHLKDATSVFRHNAWDDVEWDDERRASAEAAVVKNSSIFVEPEKQDELEEKAYCHWDTFYGIHQNKFFRDRNWLFSEFPELASPFGCSVDVEESRSGIEMRRQNESYPGENSKFKVLEIGCGAGNTVFPLLSANNNPETYVYACDFSLTAVEIVQSHPKFEPDRCTSFVLDATAVEPSVPFKLGSIDIITMIFVISAIHPKKFNQVLKNVFSFLKPGGVVLFRDYGRYDMAQLRFKEGRCLSDNFYVRGDNTRVYFFTEDEVTDLFQTNGFIKDKLIVDKRLQVNRGKQLKMYRVWIQGKFKKPM